MIKGPHRRFVQTTWLMLYTGSPSGSLCHPTPIKTWAPRFRCVSLVDGTSHMLLQLVAAGIKHVPCDPQRETLASSAWFPLDLTPCTLPFADFALRPLAVINLSREHDYIQSPVSPGESPIPGVVLGTPDTGSFASQQAWGLHAKWSLHIRTNCPRPALVRPKAPPTGHHNFI